MPRSRASKAAFTAGAAVPGVPSAGKSGTAQLGGSGEPHRWFIGYAPADDPQVAIACSSSRAVAAPPGGTDGRRLLRPSSRAAPKERQNADRTPAGEPRERRSPSSGSALAGSPTAIGALFGVVAVPAFAGGGHLRRDGVIGLDDLGVGVDPHPGLSGLVEPVGGGTRIAVATVPSPDRAPQRVGLGARAAPRREEWPDRGSASGCERRARHRRQARRGTPDACRAARPGPPPHRGRARGSARPSWPGRWRARSAARSGASSSHPTCCRPTSSASRSTTRDEDVRVPARPDLAPGGARR